MKLVLWLFALLLLAAASAYPASAQGFREGLAAYDRGDYTTAYRVFLSLAQQGRADAQFELGFMYDYGEGIVGDKAEAAKWYRHAAEQGHGLAQLRLGYLYEFGRGVPQDYAKAVKWQRGAAEQGLGAAQFNLGSMYEKGVGVPPNLERAYIWFSIAASPFPASDETHAHIAVRHRDRIAPHLPALVLARAQRIARRWRPGRNIDAGLQPPSTDDGKNAKADASGALKSGSGFRVSGEGHILTNAHVVEGCAEVRLPSAGPVSVAARDDAVDLALLKGLAGKPFAAFRQGRGVRPGAGVVAVGYPLRGVLASGANVTTGNVSALAGPGDDRRLIQITAPVQPGNSGGPVLDMAGNVVGVVVAKLDAVKVARATGDIPQNVNFAVSASAARAFLDSEGVAYATAPSVERREPVEVAAAAKAFTVLIECWGER